MPADSLLVAVAGSSGAGKSTLCRRVIAAAQAQGVGVGGFVTERRTAGRPQSGLDVVNACTGERLPLAEWDTPTGGPSTGRWHFHQAAFDAGLAWCRAVEPGALLIVDELGPLELVQGLGWAPLVPALIAHAGPILAAVRPSLAGAFAATMGDRTPAIEPLDAAARDDALVRVLSRLGLAA